MGLAESCPICESENMSADFPNDLFFEGYDEQEFSNEVKTDPMVELLERLDQHEKGIGELTMRLTEIRSDLTFLRTSKNKAFVRLVSSLIAYYESDETSIVRLSDLINNYKTLMKAMDFSSDVDNSEIRTYLYLLNYELINKEGVTYVKGLSHMKQPRTDLKTLYLEAAEKINTSKKILSDNKITSKHVSTTRTSTLQN